MKRQKWNRFVWWGLAALGAVLAVNLIANQQVFVSRVTVTHPDLPQAFAGYTVAQVSDVHSVRSEAQGERLTAAAAELAPDLIVLTGDLIDRDYYSKHFDEAGEALTLALLERLTAIAPVYYAYGNHERVLAADPDDSFRAAVEASGVTVLHNAAIPLEREDASITLAGLPDPAILSGSDGAAVKLRAMLDNTVNELPREDFVLLLSHRPEHFALYASSRADLVLSGHAHGGQFRLPFIGGLFAPGQGILPTYDAGLYEQDGTAMVVSRGIGNSVFPLRLGNPPEIVAVTLEPAAVK